MIKLMGKLRCDSYLHAGCPSPPLARVVFLIYDNDGPLRYFLADLFQLRISIEIDMKLICPELLSSSSAPDYIHSSTKDQCSKHRHLSSMVYCSWTMITLMKNTWGFTSNHIREDSNRDPVYTNANQNYTCQTFAILFK